MNFIPITLGILLALSFGTSDYLSKGVTSQIGAYRTTLYILLLSGVVILFPSLALKSSYEVSARSALLLFAVAITTFMSFAAIYRAYSRGCSRSQRP